MIARLTPVNKADVRIRLEDTTASATRGMKVRASLNIALILPSIDVTM